MFQHRSLRATTQKLRKIGPRACSTALGAPNTLGQRFGIVRERLGAGPGRLLAGSRAFLARPGRPKIGPGRAFWRPGRVPSASQRVLETALNAQNHPRPNFHRFFVEFGSPGLLFGVRFGSRVHFSSVVLECAGDVSSDVASLAASTFCSARCSFGPPSRRYSNACRF